QSPFNDRIGNGEVPVHSHAGAEAGKSGDGGRIVVAGVVEQVQADAGGPAWADEHGARPVRVAGKMIDAVIDVMGANVAAGREEHLQLDPVHEKRARIAHDWSPLDVRADQQVTEAAAVLGQRAAALLKVEADERHDYIDAPFAAEQILIGLVDQLGQGNQ